MRELQELFSSERDDEEDEEALKWAAIEKLPTYNRLRIGILSGSPNGFATEVDVRQLGRQERGILVDRLLGRNEADNKKLLLMLRQRLDRVGMEIPTTEVRFEHLKVEVDALAGSRAVPTLANFFSNVVEDILTSARALPSRKKHLNILRDISGIIKPGRMTLLLGPPGSGKTTLLLALAGKLNPQMKVSGRVTYNGHDMHEFVPQRTAAYISQYDLHLAEMTVRETLAFSARCQGVGPLYDMIAELSRREKAAKIRPDPDLDIFMKALIAGDQKENMVTDYMLKILGLDACADTIVGNQMKRGISGGQKRRLTIGEMLVGQARVLLMDEISTGLDSSTTLQIVNSLRNYISLLKGTAVISLLQPEPETYYLFDDIILLSDGFIIYQGPRQGVLNFFDSMGFKCPERKGVADFLQEVTSRKDQHRYWTHSDAPYNFVSAAQFAEAFKAFHLGCRISAEITIPFDRSKSHPAALIKNKYGASTKQLLGACISREYLVMKRNAFVYSFKLSLLTLIGLITMTVFFRSQMHKHSVDDGLLYMGVIFFTLCRILLVEYAEVELTVSKLWIFYKQRDLLFFPVWVYGLPGPILKIPLQLLGVCSWVLTTYYLIGFDPSFERFCKHFFLVLLTSLVASSLFRLVGSVARNLQIGLLIGRSLLVLLVILSGFSVSHDNLKKWSIWGYWISPVMYAQNGLSVNELLGKSWGHDLQNSTETVGVGALKSRGLFPEAYWYWLGVGVLSGYTVLFNILHSLALKSLSSPMNSPAIIPDVSPSKMKNQRSTESKKGIENNISSASSTIELYSTSEENNKAIRRLILPFKKHFITFNDVRYFIDMPKEMKNQGVLDNRLELLKGVSGAFRPGVLTALMGVTGAGKTTMLDVLSGRKTVGYIEGEIRVSGFPKKQETFARVSGYCEQNDIHSPNLTVYESLVYSAWLRLSREISRHTREMFVEEVMELVELDSLKEALVGVPGQTGLSTEQRKRLTIAVELVANPSIIFMDEPTSGLDARAAAIVMRTVRNTADTGRTVVCTIHQPSIEIFESFDELFLMKRGGQEIYVGPLGQRSCHSINYFENIDGVQRIKDGSNPAAWMLDVTSVTQELSLGVDFAEIYRNSELYRMNKALIQELCRSECVSKEPCFPNPQPFFIRLVACLWKQHRSYWHNPFYNAGRLIITVLVALMVGSILWGIGSNMQSQQDLISAAGSIYCTSMYLAFHNVGTIQSFVISERTVFYREKSAGMHSSIAYALSQVLIELPYVLVQSLLFTCIVYPMMGLERSSMKFFQYLFFVFFNYLSFTYYGLMMLFTTPNIFIASASSIFFQSFWTLFSGFVIPRPRIPIWWEWIYWLCPVSWSVYGLVTSQFGDSDHMLKEGITVGQFCDDYFGYRNDFLGLAAASSIGFCVVFACMYAFAVKFLNFQKR